MKKIRIVVICALISLVLLFALSLLFLPSLFYKNSSSLDLKENREIKKTILSAMKERYLFIGESDPDRYDEESPSEIVQLSDPCYDNGILCILAPNFMDTIEECDDDTFFVKVKMYYPEECYHEFRIKKSTSGYIITYWGIDI